jgi:hypothetical protein
MTEFLTPDRHDASRHYHDPYTTSGARSILRRFRNDVINMLDVMEQNRAIYEGGKTMLAKSPLRSKPYVAGAMKTLGLVEERPTENGSCALVLTPKAISQIEHLKKYL